MAFPFLSSAYPTVSLSKRRQSYWLLFTPLWPQRSASLRLGFAPGPVLGTVNSETR